jgi:DNA-binding transcriptional LysR family regulator
MFSKLFAESGLSLDRLKALLEVGAAGSIVKAADGEAVRQSQYSRQIKELEDFFRARLIERQGKGSRLTNNGKELARISRFFMLGLSNFQRGCLSEQQTFHIGASATFLRQFLLPALSGTGQPSSWVTETLAASEIESRLHDLRLDFGVVQSPTLSRPLQTKPLGEWKLELWVPKGLRLSAEKAAKAFEEQTLPLALARKELEFSGVLSLVGSESCLACDSFLDARAAIEGQRFAALLPHFLAPENAGNSFMRVQIPNITGQVFRFHLAWNPRLLRLNPHATQKRDWLAETLA